MAQEQIELLATQVRQLKDGSATQALVWVKKEQEREAAVQQVEQHETTIRRLEEEKAELLKTISLEQTNASNLRTERNSAQRCVQNLNAGLRMASDVVDSLSSDNIALKCEVRNLIHANATLVRERDSANGIAYQRGQDISRLQSEIGNAREACRTEKVSLKQEISALKKEKTKVEAHFTAAEQKGVQQSEIAVKLRADMDNARIESEKQKASIQLELEEMTSAKNGLVKNLATVEGHLAQERQTASNLRNQLDDVLIEAQNQKSSLEEEVEELKNDKSEVDTELNRIREAHLEENASLNERIQDMTTTENNLQSKLDSIQQEYQRVKDSLQENIRTSEKNRHDLQAKLHLANKEIEGQHETVSNLRAELNTLQTESERKHGSLRDENATWKTDMGKLQRQFDQTAQALDYGREVALSLEVHLNAAVEKERASTTQIERLQETMQKTQEEHRKELDGHEDRIREMTSRENTYSVVEIFRDGDEGVLIFDVHKAPMILQHIPAVSIEYFCDLNDIEGNMLRVTMRLRELPAPDFEDDDVSREIGSHGYNDKEEEGDSRGHDSKDESSDGGDSGSSVEPQQSPPQCSQVFEGYTLSQSQVGHPTDQFPCGVELPTPIDSKVVRAHLDSCEQSLCKMFKEQCMTICFRCKKVVKLDDNAPQHFTDCNRKYQEQLAFPKNIPIVGDEKPVFECPEYVELSFEAQIVLEQCAEKLRILSEDRQIWSHFPCRAAWTGLGKARFKKHLLSCKHKACVAFLEEHRTICPSCHMEMWLAKGADRLVECQVHDTFHTLQKAAAKHPPADPESVHLPGTQQDAAERYFTKR